MPQGFRRLADLEEIIAAAETSVALLNWVVKRRASLGRDATRLRELVRLTQKRLAELAARRERLLEDETPE